MGTQRLRASTLPALGRSVRRLLVRRRVPRHVLGHVRTRIRVGVASLATRIHRLSPSRMLAARRATGDAIVIRSNGGWKVARPNTARSARQIADGHLLEVSAALRAKEIDYFLTDPVGAIGHRLGIFERDRAASRSVLEQLGMEVMRGSPTDRQSRGLDRAPRFTAWRVHHLGQGVTTGRELGVEIEFWHRESIGWVVPDGRHGIASFEPDGSPGATISIGDRLVPTYSVFRDDIRARSVAFPIDVVYTWVDGNDEEWRASYRSHRSRAGALNPEAANPSRYTSRDELRFSMRSMWWNADFFRHAYLVTAGHVPPWLDTSHPQLTVIPHADIFPAEHLPTFNSHAIESRLHMIPGLAEHYLYMNDDFLIARPLDAAAFYSPNGIARVFLSSAPIPPGAAHVGDAPVDAAAKNGRDLIESVGYRPSRKLAHAPYPQIKTVVAEAAERFGDQVLATTRSRFRDVADISLAASLSQHYALATGRAVIGDLHHLYVNIADRWAPSHLAALLHDRNRDVFCLNETSMRGARGNRVDDLVRRFLENYFPVPSPFERHSSSPSSPPV